MSYRRTNVFLRICCLLTAALVTVKAPAYVSGAAGETPEIIYEQYFNSTATNGVPDEVTVKGEKARVIRAGENNKVLQVLSGAKTEVSFPVSSEAFKYVAEFSIAAEKSVNTSVSLQSGTSQYELLKIEDNAVRTTEGKTVGGVIANAAVKNGEMSGRMSRIAIAVNRESGIFSVYIDSKMCLYDWKLPNAAKADGITVTKAADENNNLYLDNVAAYEGEEPLSAITPTG
ncbi:MAG: hypothetical protein Q4E94_01330, partial [Clostridia bacterium]|nr:hypothetical protein [Clostridia bacterium]